MAIGYSPAPPKMELGRKHGWQGIFIGSASWFKGEENPEIVTARTAF
jgi:hypothetical protein